MNSSIFEQRSRFAMIGALMVIISLVFLFYMGSSLVSSTRIRKTTRSHFQNEMI